MPIETKDAPGFRIIYGDMLTMGIKIFIGFALLSLAFTLWRLSRKETSQNEKYLLLVAWGILPPLWFMLEYFYIFLPYGVTGSFNFFSVWAKCCI